MDTLMKNIILSPFNLLYKMNPEVTKKLDLNKVMFYENTDGTLRSNDIHNRKRYIGIVDGR